MGYACDRAAGRGDEPACGVDLLAALVADPQARAVEVLDRAGIDRHEVTARVEDFLSQSGSSSR
jgi:hypothetical protein